MPLLLIPFTPGYMPGRADVLLPYWDSSSCSSW